MIYRDDKTYYREKHFIRQNHKPFEYRLTYVGGYTYQLTKGKYKVLKHSGSFYSMYKYIREHHIPFSEVHMPYITLHEFLKYWVTFEEDEKGNNRL